MSLGALIERVRTHHPTMDLKLVERAYRFSEAAHRGQYRDSGDLFFQHPYEVARILADLELDAATVSAGLLHDVLEDTHVTREELEAEFGPEIVRLVDGVTKLSRIPFRTQEEHQAESLRKMFLAMADDLRVILIKLVDRLHNMRTLAHLPGDRQRKIAAETLEIYAPLAHRLGVWALKWEMEDLAFRYIEPAAYAELAATIAARRREREAELEAVTGEIRTRLAELEIPVEVQGRPKHLYSIYQKMRQQGKELAQVYDLVAVRVIVDSIKDCYGVLGIVHTLWKPIPGRFKDYVAMPKSNLYQSLHTTVIGPGGDPFEIQIRTREMHRTAERGIAAHWLYKQRGERGGPSEFDVKVAWLRQVMEWLRELRDPHEFLETLKIDLFEDEVFVFTPKGDVKSLPAGATPVDFAFSVHTDIGMRCTGAKVNGRLAPLDYPLKNGEFIEIMTQKAATPSQDWLRFVKTSKARSKIRAWIKEAQRAESIERGRDVLESVIARYEFDAKEVLKPENVAEGLKQLSLASPDDLWAALGFGRLSGAQVLQRLIGRRAVEARRRELKEKRLRARRQRRHAASGVQIKGGQDLLIRFSKCCNPVPGDPVVGYITRGRGVSVHRTDCPNLAQFAGEPERRLPVEWDGAEGGTYPVEIEVEALDRVNLLTNIMATVSEGKTNIEAVHARTTPGKLAFISLVVGIADVGHLKGVIERIRKVNGVLAVQRAGFRAARADGAPENSRPPLGTGARR